MENKNWANQTEIEEMEMSRKNQKDRGLVWDI